MHVVIDKNNVGVDTLKANIANNGIQTSASLGIQLAAGSQRLQHHLHVFLWDGSVAGMRGCGSLLFTKDSFPVFVRWENLTETGLIFSGTLLGDNGQNGVPSGRSTNGAWAFKGCIPAKYCFVSGHHSSETLGYDDWREYRGWP